MALIKIDIPDEEGWRDDLASRVLWVMLGAVLLLIGVRLWAATSPERWPAAVATFGAFAGGVQAFLIAISDIDLRKHGRKMAYLYVGLLVATTLAAIVGANWPSRLGTDALAFTSYSVELLDHGVNPMAASMGASEYLPGAPEKWTYYVDGSRVESWSYPAGMLYVYGFQYELVGRWPIGIRLTSILGVAGLALTLIRVLPAVYAPLGVLALIVPRNQFLAAAGGIVDVWWVLPTVVAMVLWYHDRLFLAAAALGLACAMKQQAWAIAPFLAIWLWHDRDSLRQFGRVGGGCAAIGAGVFALLNAPFILLDPAAWWESVFVPIAGEPLRSTGVGLAAFNRAGLDLPRPLFRAATVTIAIAYVVAYWRWFDRVKWTAWLAPAVLLLWAPRSLPSYFEWGVPLAVVALFAAHAHVWHPREQGVSG